MERGFKALPSTEEFKKFLIKEEPFLRFRLYSRILETNSRDLFAWKIGKALATASS